MAKATKVFECGHCGAQFQKWVGRCLECGAWGEVKEIFKAAAKIDAETVSPVKTVALDEIKGGDVTRAKSGLKEFDRVLGGGVVPGSLLLLGGEPGVGKSTLALQIAALFPTVLYFSGEESVEQIKLRADRLKLDARQANRLRFANETDIDGIIATIKKYRPNVAIVDSVQTIHSDTTEGNAGNVSQVRACTAQLMEAAKSSNTAVILIGQVTKDGAVAGPKTLEHLVDTVLYLEGERFHQFRILRAAKNRFGSTDEVGIFTMEENGLAEVKNPSQAFLSERPEGVPGSAVTCLMEGTRPILVEIQALVTKTNFGYPVRRASGFDLNRLQVLIGVLTKRVGLPLDTYDVFINVVGGMEASEPAADLAAALAIASAFKNKHLPPTLVSFGEIGLGGEVRQVAHAKRRLEEIKKLGFEFAAVPHVSDNIKIPGLKIAPVKNIGEIVEQIIS